MRHVIVPEPVTIVDPRTKEPVLAAQDAEGKLPPKPFVINHDRFISDHICAVPEFVNGGVKALRRALKITEAFEGCKPGDVIAVEDADYEEAVKMLADIKWAPAFARFAVQMLPHLEAWEAAKDQDIAWKRRLDKADEAPEEAPKRKRLAAVLDEPDAS